VFCGRDPADLKREVERIRAILADGATTVAGRTVELRNGTFLFCDLVQSTRLTTRLNADDLVAVFRTYRNTVAKIAAANNVKGLFPILPSPRSPGP